MNTLPKLYKRNKVWTISHQGCWVHISFGDHHGVQQKESIECPSPEKAAQEAQSRWNKKVDRESYSETPYNWPKTPMLALEYIEHGHKLPSTIMIQPKLDGFRCVATNCEMQTRQNTIICSMPHIKQALSAIPDGIVLDGELYCHGRSFQDHLTIIKRDNVHPDFMDISYHIYDIQDSAPFNQRIARLELILSGLNNPYLKLVPTREVPKRSAEELRDSYILDGYEGAILRDPYASYEYGRTAALQKFKREDTTDFQIIGWKAATTGREKGCAIAECITENGLPFTARLTGTLEYRKATFKHQPPILPSLKARILHYGYYDSGIPKQPRCDSYFYGSSQ